MKFVTVVGARPQFVKAGPVCRALRGRGHAEVLVHTGQHYDDNMSRVFFEELSIPEPDYNLNVGSGLHGAQTGAMLARLEEVLIREKPRVVLIFGDTNSTLAAALAAAKLGVDLAHVEAGLRSFNRSMPEEINRVVADHLSRVLLCPSEGSAEQLAREGISRGVHVVGDVMADALGASRRAGEASRVLEVLGLEHGKYLVATIHRAENTDDGDRLQNLLETLGDCGETVVFPIHPRTRTRLQALAGGVGGSVPDNVRLVDPLGYVDMVRLTRSARLVLTDSGGLQKEAYWLGVPCVTLRNETEWTETVATGWNVLTGTDPVLIRRAVAELVPPVARPELYGDGNSAVRIVEAIEREIEME